MQPNVSVIIPAYNSAATIKETLQSVLKQTFPDWEAVIVDDGSTDETDKIVHEYVKRDKRFRCIKQEKSGVSAARNKGIDNAVYDWLLFLDADDLIKPDMLDKMIKGIKLHPDCDLILCNWERLTINGKTIKEIGPDWSAVDAFNLFAVTCAFCIHSCVVKKSAVMKVGKFDQTLITCEDWDLWQRIARTGAKFTLVTDSLAVYRMRSASASNKGIQLFKDGMTVVKRGHSADDRVKEPDEKYVNGTTTPDLQRAFNGLFTWSAGLMFGSGDDPAKLLEFFSSGEKIFFDVEAFTSDFFRAAILPTGCSFEIWEKLYSEKFELLKSFLEKAADLTTAPEFVKRSLSSFERLFFYESGLSGPKILGSTFGTIIDITQPINHLKIDGHIEKIIIKLKANEKIFGNIELPAAGGFIHKYVIKDAAAENYAWQILGEFFIENIYKRLGLIRKIGLKIRLKQYKQSITKASENYYEKLHNFIGWTIFLQEIFKKPFWTSSRFYRSARQLKPARTLFQNGGPITIEIGNEIPNLKLNEEEAVLVITAGGNASAVIKITGKKKFLNAQEVRSIIIKELGYDLCKMIAREILLEEDLSEIIPLYKRVRKKYRQTAGQYSIKKGELRYNIADEIEKIKVSNERGIILPRRDSFYPDDSSARYAMLPVNGMIYPSASFFINEGEKIKLIAGREEREKLESLHEFKYMLYAPNIILHEDLNSLKLFTEDTWKPKKKSPVIHKLNTRDLPVLMYHRIASSGSDLTKPYRIPPTEFEKQMQYLYNEGYKTVSFEQWYASVKTNNPLPGKDIILTFDDGYLDFYQYAYPILSKYGFNAYVYIVTDFAGKMNVWDRKLGEQLPLMSWEHIKELSGKGIYFGSHTANHKPLTALNSEQLACQFFNSLNTLRDYLGLPISSVAYPYGDYDAVVKHLAGACGYSFALTCEEGKCNKFSEPLALPRIEIAGSDTLDAFIKKVNLIPIYPG